jgi:hypothetical protein
MAGWKQNVIFDIVPVAASALFIALMVHCTMDLAGGSSEIGNGRVIGRVVDEQGKPACSTIVRIMPSDYNPLKNGPLADTCIDTTDADGMYRFVARHGQTFSIQAVHMALRTRVIVPRVEMKNADLTVPQCTLKVPGAIKVSLQDSIDPLFGYVYVPGSDIFAFLNNSTGPVTLDSVPAGVIPAVSYSSTVNSASTVIRYDVPVISGTTTVVYNPSWKYARRLVLNTTPGGANVSGNVYNFPVLIRLTAGNFTFAHAKADGRDLRFTKDDNTPLPYEIERYDAGSFRAEIWVKADTVYGNDGSHFITMYWGNPDAADSSSGAAVFDTMNGFQGTWHLGETDPLALDATGNCYNGTGYFTASVAGIIGNAQHFNGVSSYIRMKGTAPQSRLNFPMNGLYTVSAWIYHDTLADSVTYVIAGKGEHQYFIKSFDLRLSTAQREHQWEFTEYHGNDIWQAATFVPAAGKTWIYLVGIRDGSNQYLYVNGALAMQGYQVFGTGQSTVPRDTSDDFSIGAFLHPTTAWNQGYAWFSGAIDEVGVSSVPRSADWIKLCYMNQKEQDALVKW